MREVSNCSLRLSTFKERLFHCCFGWESRKKSVFQLSNMLHFRRSRDASQRAIQVVEISHRAPLSTAKKLGVVFFFLSPELLEFL